MHATNFSRMHRASPLSSRSVHVSVLQLNKTGAVGSIFPVPSVATHGDAAVATTILLRGIKSPPASGTHLLVGVAVLRHAVPQGFPRNVIVLERVHRDYHGLIARANLHEV